MQIYLFPIHPSLYTFALLLMKPQWGNVSIKHARGGGEVDVPLGLPHSTGSSAGEAACRSTSEEASAPLVLLRKRCQNSGFFLSAPLGSSHRVSGIRYVGRLHKAEIILLNHWFIHGHQLTCNVQEFQLHTTGQFSVLCCSYMHTSPVCFLCHNCFCAQAVFMHF